MRTFEFWAYLCGTTATEQVGFLLDDDLSDEGSLEGWLNGFPASKPQPTVVEDTVNQKWRRVRVTFEVLS